MATRYVSAALMLAAGFLVVCLAAQAQAAGLLVHEDFEYGSKVWLAGRSGGFGWDSAWRGAGVNNRFKAINMPAPDYQWSPPDLQTGSYGAQRPALLGRASASRTISAPLMTEDNSELWFGMVFADNANGSGLQAFAFASGDFIAAENTPKLPTDTFGIGFQVSSQSQLDARAWSGASSLGDSAILTIPVANAVVGYLAAKIEWGTADTEDESKHSVTVWRLTASQLDTDPDPAAGVTLSGLNFDQSALNVFTMQDNKAFTIDQLRFARTFADLVGPAVQEPDAIPGDANLDGVVDSQDFTILKANFGEGTEGDPAIWGEGNFNDDTVVDSQDFTILKAHYGEGGSAGATAVPEPATLVLLVGAGVPILLRRKGGNRQQAIGSRQ